MLGQQLKQQGMSRVAAANGAWIIQAKAAGKLIASKRSEFTTDPIWWILAKWGVAPPTERRAMGPVMDALMREGTCENTGAVRPSVRPECHRRPVTVYRSLVFHG